tara:strand:+ start:12736 stop:13053 length:318 start_codon:yes stop_codon:yes gene_type:complete
MVEDDLFSEEYKTNFIKLASKLGGWIKAKDGSLLSPVKIKGGGKGFYWSISDKRFVWVDKSLEWYYVGGVAPDDRGRLCLYSPFIFASGILCRVPKEEVEFVGFN